MGKAIEDLEVQIYEWPDRFFVECEYPDRDYAFFFPQAPPEDIPEFVDVAEPFCSCRDFRFNIQPFLDSSGPHRVDCKHLIAARRYRNLLGTKPKPLCLSLSVETVPLCTIATETTAHSVSETTQK